MINREYLTLACGILLVGSIAALSVWQNTTLQGRTAAARAADPHPAPPAATAPTPATAPAPAPTIPAAATSAGPARPVSDATPRLDASIAVVHKHRFGSCEGMLRAVPGTLAFSSADKSDAFRVAMAEVDLFDIDPAKKALRVRRRGGRTWNFEAKGDNTSLGAFYREVDRARRR